MVLPSGGAIVFPVVVPGVLTISQAVQPGEGLRIKLEDADHNTDPGLVDQVVVEVRNMNPGNPDLELVTLIETDPATGLTDPNTGIFTINPLGTPSPGLPTSPSSGAVGVLKIGDTDVIEVRHDDIGEPVDLTASSFGALWGDTSTNGTLSALDASLILIHAVTPGGSFVDPLPLASYRMLVGDVHPGAGYPDPDEWDASLILRVVVELPALTDPGWPLGVFPVQVSTHNIPNPHPYKPLSNARSLALGATERSTTGGLLWVPVVVSEMDGVLAGNLTLAFDPTQYKVGDVSTTAGTADFLVASNVVDGRLRIAFAGAESRSEGAGTILRIPIEPLPNVTPSAYPFELEETTLNGGTSSVEIVDDPTTFVLPDSYTLWQNWPNPFNPETQIRYSLPQESFVELIVYDLLGQTVRTLVFDYQQPGSYTLMWDGRDNSGYAAAAGIYLYSLRVGDVIQTRKMALIR